MKTLYGLQMCLPMYLLQPAIRSDVKPVMILANVNTAMKAGPAKIWYSIPLPVQLYSHLGSAIQMLPFSNLSQKLTADVSLELTASHFWSPNWTSENSNHIGILIGYAVKKNRFKICMIVTCAFSASSSRFLKHNEPRIAQLKNT